jgi:hypothetical protein
METHHSTVKVQNETAWSISTSMEVWNDNVAPSMKAAKRELTVMVRVCRAMSEDELEHDSIAKAPV